MKTLSLSLLLSLSLAACSAQSADKSAPEKSETAQEAKAEKPAAAAQKTKLSPDFPTTLIRDDIYLLTGPGGNMAISVGEDGLFVIDDKYDRFGEDVLASIRKLSDKPIQFVINTHYHGDHTGGNAHMHAVGATVVAHDNVRKRMGTSFKNNLFGRDVPATDPSLWPNVSLKDNATIYQNGQSIDIVHTPHAHTDGDSIVYFQEANILHMGDNYFNGMFPFIDVDGGGSIDGMIAAHEAGLALANDDTVIIPGHGPLAGKADLMATQATLQTIRERVQAGLDKGQTEDDMVKDAILSDMGELSSFIDEEKMIRSAARSLSKE